MLKTIQEPLVVISSNIEEYIIPKMDYIVVMIIIIINNVVNIFITITTNIISTNIMNI